MKNSEQYSVDADESTFDREVLQASNKHLVLVDFWAPWCGPCRSLAPILDKLIDAYPGAVRLAKVNTDENQQLAARYGIRSLPTVLLFKKGEAVDQFMGVQPEPFIRRLIDRYVVRASDEQLERAQSLHASGDAAGAIGLLQLALESDPDNDRPRFALAEWLAEEERFEEAEAVLDGTRPDGREDPRFSKLSARIQLGMKADSGRSTAELMATVARNENDLEARFQLAGRMVRDGDLAGALEHLIEVIQRDRHFRQDEPRQTVLRIFDLAGGKGELVSKYRRRLAQALN